MTKLLHYEVCNREGRCTAYLLARNLEQAADIARRDPLICAFTGKVVMISRVYLNARTRNVTTPIILHI